MFHTVKELWSRHSCLAYTHRRKKTKLPEFSSLFKKHSLDMIKSSVKFHEYIPHGLGVMAQTQLFCMHACMHRRSG